MRIKVYGQIIEKTKIEKTNYNHEIQSMILNKLSPKTAQKLHKKEKFFRLLTFTNICIDRNKGNAHFYMSGEDILINEFIQNIIHDNVIRIDDMVLVVKIQQIEDLTEKKEYNFKTKLVINIYDKEQQKARLCEDFKEIKEKLIKNCLSKCSQLGLTGNINIDILNPKKIVAKYKNGHIFSWKCNLKVKGDYNIINTIYNVGIGENTFTGNGFLWEC